MAKPRKNYISRKKPAWQVITFYLLIALIITGMLYYSGLINIGDSNSKSDSEFSNTDYNYIE